MHPVSAKGHLQGAVPARLRCQRKSAPKYHRLFAANAGGSVGALWCWQRSDPMDCGGLVRDEGGDIEYVLRVHLCQRPSGFFCGAVQRIWPCMPRNRNITGQRNCPPAHPSLVGTGCVHKKKRDFCHPGNQLPGAEIPFFVPGEGTFSTRLLSDVAIQSKKQCGHNMPPKIAAVYRRKTMGLQNER